MPKLVSTAVQLAALLPTLLVAAPALAQEKPVLRPVRDVAVDYRAIGGPAGSEAITTRMEWSQSLQKLRVDVPGIGWSVADHGKGRGFIVMQEARRIMDMPTLVQQAQLGPAPDATFTKEGTAQLAGLACTIWRYRDKNSEGTTCLTAEGVMLRTLATMSGITGGSEAISVAFGPQDPARFDEPEGYARVQPRQPRTRPQP
ncbi:MAG: hypothetical protein ACOVN4_14975 [Bosea sp. (in: a-proteobacteria)]|jgi:hypothetical protein